MKLKDVLIGLVIFQIATTIYYLKNILSYVWQSITSFGYGEFTSIASVFGQVFNIVFMIVAIVGVVLYFTQQNIYNRALKAFLIHHTTTLIFYLPQRLAFLVSSFESMPWYQHLLFLGAIITSIVAIVVYSSQPIRVLPRPVSRNTVRLLHYFIDQAYLTLNTIGASSLFLLRGGFFGLNDSSSLIIGYSMLLLMPLAYYFICEAGFNQTLGKVISGAYVRSASGTKAGVMNLIGRTLCRMIPFEPFSYLPDPMAKWHDKFSGTDVFYKSNVNLGEEDPLIDHLVSEEDWRNEY